MKIHFNDIEIEAMKQYGIRNCSLLSIAPSGSIGTLLNITTGCEPAFRISYKRKTESLHKDKDVYYDVFIQEAQEFKNLYPNVVDLPDYFVASNDINWKDRIKMQAILQNHIDTAISSTVNLPNEITVKEIEKLYLSAWECGLKGITIFRDGCKRIGILTTDESETKSEIKTNNNKTKSETENELKRGEIIATDDNIIGLKRKLMTGCGSLHCQAFFDPKNGELREIYLSKGSTGGCLNFMTGLSRFISMAARAGIPLGDIVDQLMSTGACPSYAKRGQSKGSCCPMAVGYALKDMYKQFNEMISTQHKKVEKKLEDTNKTHNEKHEENKAVCPECGESIVFEGGCNICKACGWSKCD